MGIQKIDVVNLIGGLSASAQNLVNVVDCGKATKAILQAIEKLATAISDSPATDISLSAVPDEKSSK